MKNLLNISIDDISPHPKSSTRVLERCFELIKIFPDIKFTLFIPVSYWRTMNPQTATTVPLQIDQFKEFCDTLISLPENNFELGYHGYHHGIPGVSDNDEMQSLSYEHCCQMLEQVFKVANLANLKEKFEPILRPPAWRMSKDSFRACKDMGIEILALSPYDNEELTLYGNGNSPQDSYEGEDKKFEKVIYYNCNPPLNKLSLFPTTEIVYHACEWDNNYLDVKKTLSLSRFLKENLEKIEFVFMGEM